MLVALTREVSPAIGRCELTHLPRVPIDAAVAAVQHRAYRSALADLGCEVVVLPAEAGFPDSVFIEDTAVVVDEVAVVLRPGAASRQGETPAVATALAEYREIAMIGAPGSVDGGDVLRIGRTLYVGCAEAGRSNATGIAQLEAALAPFDYRVQAVPVRGCLHLKSAVTQVATATLLINREWVDAGAFAHVAYVDVHPGEPRAANALLVGGAVIYPASHPRTAERLAKRGIVVRTVDVSELEKAEGAVTCCSVIFEA
ncbi:MAG: dimethylargininase [Gemmatimonadales bacterium]|jgi:dimethylargininase